MTAPRSNAVIEFSRSADSTQAVLRERVRRLAGGRGMPPTVVVAAEQSAGFGRFSRPWSSPRGGLWCTLAWPLPDDPSAILDGLGLRVGIACTEFVRTLVREQDASRVQLKWPNDVVLDGKKVLGVLCELVAPAGSNPPPAPPSEGEPLAALGGRQLRSPYLLIGIGLNANFPASALPPDLRDTATTLQSALDLTIDLGRAVTDLAARLQIVLTNSGLDLATLARARELLHAVGQPTRVSLPTGDKVVATLIGLDRAGNAVFEQSGSRWAAPDGIEFSAATHGP